METQLLQRKMIEDEVKHLLNEINAVTQRARFGDRALLDGNFKDQVIRDNGLNDSNINISFPKISTAKLGSQHYASGAITLCSTSPAANPVTMTTLQLRDIWDRKRLRL